MEPGRISALAGHDDIGVDDVVDGDQLVDPDPVLDGDVGQPLTTTDHVIVIVVVALAGLDTAWGQQTDNKQQDNQPRDESERPAVFNNADDLDNFGQTARSCRHFFHLSSLESIDN